ncbi:hypothetical protein [Microbacterium sp. MMO-10]|uniref:hypothetical protein n=1 Tax=Microbacterium sp. MMO-10 TaxID=3081272 RepID=UPI003019F948
MCEKVAEIRPEIEGAEANLATARLRLMAEISGAQAPKRVPSTRSPWYFVAGGVGAVAAAAATAILIGNLTAPGPEPTAVAHPTSLPTQTARPVPAPDPTAPAVPETASSVLRAAAASAIHGGLAPRSDQYLRIAWTADVVFLSDGTTIASPNQGLSASMATRAWVVRSSGVFYVPADPTADWYFAPAAAPTLAAAYGPDEAADALMRAFLDRWASAGEAGGFREGGGSLPEGDGTRYGDYLTSLPGDADGILGQLLATQNGSSDYHLRAMAGWKLMTLLASNAGGGDVRAAMLQALGQLPGSSIIDSHGSVRTIAFDSTYGEAPDESGDVQRHQTLTVDVSTGRVTGISDSTDPGTGVVPAGVADEQRSYVVDLVDGLPG